ncbi:MAG: TetR/AcrR family transcriptional regulator [Ketobacteraceae bacterium]|nr:TetR/AcrR family transcriptional regulator [Ketobacteraceae bacterium]
MGKSATPETVNIRKARPENPEYAEIRQHIVDEAIELMAEQGFEKFRFDQLAKRVGRNRTTIYRYFDSKQELITEAMKTLMTEITENIIADTANTKATTPESFTDNLYRVIHAIGTKDRYRIIMDAQNIKEFAVLVKQNLTEITALMLSRFMVDSTAGRMLRTDIDMDEAVHWLFHQIISYGFFGLKGKTRKEQKQYLHRMVTPVLFTSS